MFLTIDKAWLIKTTKGIPVHDTVGLLGGRERIRLDRILEKDGISVKFKTRQSSSHLGGPVRATTDFISGSHDQAPHRASSLLYIHTYIHKGNKAVFERARRKAALCVMGFASHWAEKRTQGAQA